jgi:hypothetical protein
MAVEVVADLVATDTKLKTLEKELKVAVLARGSHLMELPGIGPAGAARTLDDVGDIARCPNRDHFASWTGTAPIDASSGEQIRHRLFQATGGRTTLLHIAAMSQVRLDTEGRVYYRRKLEEAKTPKQARRCLKRRISDAVYRQLVDDAKLTEQPAAHTVENGHEAGTRGRLQNPARPICTPRSSALRISHNPSPQHRRSTAPGDAEHPAQLRHHSPASARRSRQRAAPPTGRTTLTATSACALSKEPIPVP